MPLRGVKRVFDWLRMTREGGLEALLKRGDMRLLKDKSQVKRQIKKGLGEGCLGRCAAIEPVAQRGARQGGQRQHGMDPAENPEGRRAHCIPEETMRRCGS